MADSSAKTTPAAKLRSAANSNASDTSSGNGKAEVANKTSGTGRTELAAPAGTDSTGEKGRTSIADVVVAKIAGMAAREIPGIYELGGGAARAFRAIRERVPGAGKASVSQGVSVEVGERQAAVDLVLVIEYGVSISDVAQAVRENIIDAVERMTGLEVVEVNIAIDDIHLPELDDDTDSDSDEPRTSGRRLE